jgi:hypothetical protein
MLLRWQRRGKAGRCQEYFQNEKRAAPIARRGPFVYATKRTLPSALRRPPLTCVLNHRLTSRWPRSINFAREVALTRESKFWLVVGTPVNWHTAFDFGGIWGLKNSQRHYWEDLSENTDIAMFYVTSPVSGIVGYGLVRNKLHQLSPLWPEERAKNEVIWPLRFEFDVVSCLPPAVWESGRFAAESLKARVRGGFQGLDAVTAAQAMQALPAGLPGGLVLPRVAQSSAAPRPAETPAELPAGDPHARSQAMIAEIGRMQRFVAETEFRLENRRLDVVWRRVQRSVPSYVFEVQVAGNMTDAMAKLKSAFDLWNSNLFLAGPGDQRRSFDQLAGGSFHEIRHRVQFLELATVEELYRRKRSYLEYERQLGILR